MALGSGWWAGTWAANCIPDADVWSDATVAVEEMDDLWNAVFIYYAASLYQRDRAYGMPYDIDNGSMFYIRNKTTGELTPAAEIFRLPSQGAASSFYPSAENGEDIERFDVSMDVVFNSPFTPTSGVDESDYQVIVTNRPNAASGEAFEIVHHCAWAWHGLPSQVIAAMILKLGVASSWLDTTAIDNAYDGEYNDHISFPPIYAPRVYAARQIGKPIIDLIKRVAAHSWTRVGYTMKGLLACWSATRPVEYAASGLAGIKGNVSWSITDSHLYNIIEASYGQVSRSSIGGSGRSPTVIDGNVEVANPDYVFRSAWEPMLEGARSDRWTVSDEDATSQAAHGVIALNGADESGKAIKTHYELYADNLSLVGMVPRIDKFCHPLREVVLPQDLRGLDYEVGTLITDYTTGDGVTADYFCIKKMIDFNNLTVESTLLEDLA